jgi:hypothetical protein
LNRDVESVGRNYILIDDWLLPLKIYMVVLFDNTSESGERSTQNISELDGNLDNTDVRNLLASAIRYISKLASAPNTQ